MGKLVEWLDKLIALVPFIILAMLGGAANNTYQNVVKKQPFSGGMFLVAVFLAGFVGTVVSVTPLPDILVPYRESLACMMGFCAYPVLHIVETELPALLRRWFRRWLPSERQGKDTEN